ncbi:MAG: aromatic acid exporter family protein [Clostridiaceae bacterium]
MEKVRKYIGLRTIKTAVGAALAIFIAQLIGLSYAANSGIIMILSLQNTKKKSKDLALQRIISTVLALTIGSIAYSTIGFNALAFGIYLLIFIPIIVKLGFNESIVPCSVLVTHLLTIQSVEPKWLLNEFLQMVIGAGIALILNMHIKSMECELDEDVSTIEASLKAVLENFVQCLKKPFRTEPDEALIKRLEKDIESGETRAIWEAGNQPQGRCSYYLRYMEMRKEQFEIIKYMKKYVRDIQEETEFTELTANLTDFVSKHNSNEDMKESVITGLCEYRRIFSSIDLPKTREEFEHRAALFEYVNDLEHLLNIKRTFLRETEVSADMD